MTRQSVVPRVYGKGNQSTPTTTPPHRRHRPPPHVPGPSSQKAALAAPAPGQTHLRRRDKKPLAQRDNGNDMRSSRRQTHARV